MRGGGLLGCGLGSFLLVGCTAGAAAESLRPQEATMQDVAGASAFARDARPRMLVVDWRPEDRGDLEVSMKQGVAVMALDNRGIRLLDCNAQGDYGFLGMTRKERVIRLNNEDEVAANLPLGGASIAAKIGAGLDRGTSLDVALVMVGKQTTTVRRAYRKQLEGNCEGATHFVRATTVGAFAMATSTRASISAAAEVFELGVDTSSTSSKDVRSTDGLLASCDSADPNAEAPPNQCGALLRVELAPLLDDPVDPNSLAPPPPIPPEGVYDACPPGTTLVGDKCTAARARGTGSCKWRDVEDCRDKCGNDDARSCFNLGSAYERGTEIPRDPTKAFAGYALSCKLGDEYGCRGMAYLYANGIGVQQSFPKAVAILEPACEAGDATACSNLGVMTFRGQGVTKDLERTVGLYRRACEGGSGAGCVNLGQVYLEGVARPRDEQKARDLFVRACRADHPRGCSELAYLYETGVAVPQSLDEAMRLYHHSCRLGYDKVCVNLGIRFDIGEGGVAKDPNRAFAYLAKACDLGSLRGCANVALMHRDGRGTPRDPSRAVEIFTETCRSGMACDSLGELYALGLGVVQDKARAKQILQDACGKQDQRSCDKLKELKL